MLRDVVACLSLAALGTGARNFGEGHRLKGTAQMVLGTGVILVSFGLPVSHSLIGSVGYLTLMTSSVGFCSAGLSNLLEKKWKKGSVQLLAGSLSATLSTVFLRGPVNHILVSNALSGVSGSLSVVGRKVWDSSDRLLGGCLSRTATTALRSLGLDKYA